MNYTSYKRPQINPIVNNIKDCITRSMNRLDEKLVSECTDRIINSIENKGESIVKEKVRGKEERRTTISSYRRLHELIATALDYCMSQQRPEQVILRLSRAKVMIEYQFSRNQMSQGIRDLLMALVSSTMDKIKGSSGDYKVAKDACRYARLLLDAIAVLVYRHGEKWR